MAASTKLVAGESTFTVLTFPGYLGRLLQRQTLNDALEQRHFGSLLYRLPHHHWLWVISIQFQCPPLLWLSSVCHDFCVSVCVYHLSVLTALGTSKYAFICHVIMMCADGSSRELCPLGVICIFDCLSYLPSIFYLPCYPTGGDKDEERELERRKTTTGHDDCRSFCRAILR